MGGTRKQVVNKMRDVENAGEHPQRKQKEPQNLRSGVSECEVAAEYVVNHKHKRVRPDERQRVSDDLIEAVFDRVGKPVCRTAN